MTMSRQLRDMILAGAIAIGLAVAVYAQVTP